MAEVVLRDVVKTYGDVVGGQQRLADRRGRRVRGAGRPVGLRQDDDAQPDRRADRAHRAATSIIGDRQVTDLDPKDRDIAMVFQNYALYPNKTVYKNLAFPLKMRKLPKAEIDKKVHGGGEGPRHRRICSSAGRASSPAASSSAWRSAARWSATRGLPDGRAAVQPRRQAARPDARGAEALPPGPATRRSSTSPTTSSKP